MIRYELLEATNKQWIVALELAAVGVMLTGVAASFVIAMWNPDWMALGIAFGTVVSLAMEFYAHYAFYNLVQCPACGGKLNRYKNGKNVPTKQAFTQLSTGHKCRHCGWQPTVGA